MAQFVDQPRGRKTRGCIGLLQQFYKCDVAHRTECNALGYSLPQFLQERIVNRLLRTIHCGIAHVDPISSVEIDLPLARDLSPEPVHQTANVLIRRDARLCPVQLNRSGHGSRINFFKAT
ncbi:MAG: hypothetical protein IPJ97_13015, partial [Proteobacteria bacterium]|nr:hypothetical protein [Pseudomonadota bacterium]